MRTKPVYPLTPKKIAQQTLQLPESISPASTEGLVGIITGSSLKKCNKKIGKNVR
jgi:hypothetical protein